MITRKGGMPNGSPLRAARLARSFRDPSLALRACRNASDGIVRQRRVRPRQLWTVLRSLGIERFDSTRPRREQDSQIGAVHHTVAVEVR